MVGYKYSKSDTKDKIVRDNLGRDWLSCGVIGYVNEFGNPIYLGREEDVVILNDGNPYPLYMIDTAVCKDSKNVLSCSAVIPKDNEDVVVINVEFSPLKRKGDAAVIESIRKRCKTILPEKLFDNIYYRIIDNENSYPLTGSGKRSYTVLEEMPLTDVKKLSDNSNYKSQSNVYIKTGGW